jgi:hypothetical protein
MSVVKVVGGGTITFTGGDLKRGMLFTIAGFGVGSKGQTVIDGVNPKTGRKCKAVKLKVFKAGKVL